MCDKARESYRCWVCRRLVYVSCVLSDLELGPPNHFTFVFSYVVAVVCTVAASCSSLALPYGANLLYDSSKRGFGLSAVKGHHFLHGTDPQAPRPPTAHITCTVLKEQRVRCCRGLIRVANSAQLLRLGAISVQLPSYGHVQHLLLDNAERPRC